MLSGHSTEFHKGDFAVLDEGATVRAHTTETSSFRIARNPPTYETFSGLASDRARQASLLDGATTSLAA